MRPLVAPQQFCGGLDARQIGEVLAWSAQLRRWSWRWGEYSVVWDILSATSSRTQTLNTLSRITRSLGHPGAGPTITRCSRLADVKSDMDIVSADLD